jgi:hypothetical protein
LLISHMKIDILLAHYYLAVKQKAKMCPAEPGQRQTEKNVGLCTTAPLAKPLIVLVAKAEIMIDRRKIIGASTGLQSCWLNPCRHVEDLRRPVDCCFMEEGRKSI